MATFDTLIDDLAGRFGLGGSARALVEEVLAVISASPGGLAGVLDTLKSEGLASEAESWLGHPDAAPIAAGQVERALGAAAVSGIAGRLGLGQGAVSTALGYALPKIVGLLTPGGAVPAGVPPEVGAFLAQPQAAAAPVAPRRIESLPPSPPSESNVGRPIQVLAAPFAVGPTPPARRPAMRGARAKRIVLNWRPPEARHERESQARRDPGGRHCRLQPPRSRRRSTQDTHPDMPERETP